MQRFRSPQSYHRRPQRRGKRDVVGIEIKAGRTVSPRDAHGLQSLAETLGRYKPLRRWIAYRGDHPQVFGDGAEALRYGQMRARLGSEPG